MRIDYKIGDKFDFAVFIPALMLAVIGLVAIFSSTYNHPVAGGNFERQFLWLIASLVVFLIIYFLPSRSFFIAAVPIYAISLILLIAVLFAGKTVYGAKSWLALGPVGFQPSEFAKIGTIFFLAYWLGKNRGDINNLKDIGAALIIGFIPVLLILMEPDMGTAIVFMFITFIMIFWSGINLFSIFVVVSPAIVFFASLFGTGVFILALVFVLLALYFFRRNLFLSATVFVMNIAAGFFFDYVYRFLQPHQQKRLESFIDPNADPLGSGYNALQAKVAIGSGGLLGKGFMEGNQTQLRFIPEQWTDFIYCVIGEEFGFIGSIFVLLLFFIVMVRLLDISATTKNTFSSLVVVGILSMIFIHFAINIGMNVGITPVIGLPLPFVSYGGSSLLVNMMMLGVVMNIYKNRKQYA